MYTCDRGNGLIRYPFHLLHFRHQQRDPFRKRLGINPFRHQHNILRAPRAASGNSAFSPAISASASATSAAVETTNFHWHSLTTPPPPVANFCSTSRLIRCRSCSAAKRPPSRSCGTEFESFGDTDARSIPPTGKFSSHNVPGHSTVTCFPAALKGGDEPQPFPETSSVRPRSSRRAAPQTPTLWRQFPPRSCRRLPDSTTHTAYHTRRTANCTRSRAQTRSARPAACPRPESNKIPGNSSYHEP